VPINSVPAAGTGFAAQEIAIFSSCNTTTGAIGGTCVLGGNNSGSNLEIENVAGTNVTCPSGNGTIDANACKLPNSSSNQTYTITAVGFMVSN
jgi:hypothetical protein